MSAPSAPTTSPAVASEERRFLLTGVPWATYVALRDSVDESRMTYLEGRLELMSPSPRHEDVKKLIARLLEIYAFERRLDLRGFGETTFRREAVERGLEPDECYVVGRSIEAGDMPDLAIEVVVTNPLVDKLTVYAGLGIPEVWTWRDGALTIRRLAGDRYEERARSDALPDLDVGLLAKFVVPGANQTEQVRRYADALRAEGADPEG